MIDWDQHAAPVVGIFGEPVTYIPSGGAPYAITAVFTEAYTEVQLVDDVPVSTVKPALGARLSAFRDDPQVGDLLTIGRTGTTYVVNNTNPDGRGGVRLLLNWVSG